MKKKYIFSALALTLMWGWIYFVFWDKWPAEEYTTALAERGKLIQTVSETGTLKATDEIDLNFLNTGKVAKINVSLWDKVQAGDTLAELDFSDLTIKKNEAQANVEIAQASYNKLLAGATRHEIAVVQANVNQAQTNYQNAIKELEDTRRTENENLKQAQNKLQDFISKTPEDLTAQEQAVALAETNLQNAKSTYGQILDHRKDSTFQIAESNISVATYALDIINTMLTDDIIKSGLGLKDSASLTKSKELYADGIELRDEANDCFKNYQNGTQELGILIQKDKELLDKTFSALNEFYTVLENSVTTIHLPQNDLDAKKLSVNTQITTVSNAVNSVQTAEQNLNDAQIAYTTKVNTAEENLKQANANLSDAITSARNQLDVVEVLVKQKITTAESRVSNTKELLNIAEAQLSQIKAPARSQDVSLQKAQLKQAKAMLAVAENNIEKSILKAPIDGIITKIEYEIGEMVSTKPIISILNSYDLEIEVDISETDISKIELGDKVETTLDAFTDDLKFYGKVLEIEPAETIIQDVIYYKVKTNIDFPEQYLTQVKPGMTANVIITTEEKYDAMLVPSRSILDRNGDGKVIRILENGVLKEEKVEVGLRGDDGVIEVVSDLAEGTEVVTFVKKK